MKYFRGFAYSATMAVEQYGGSKAYANIFFLINYF